MSEEVKNHESFTRLIHGGSEIRTDAVQRASENELKEIKERVERRRETGGGRRIWLGKNMALKHSFLEQPGTPESASM